MTSTRIKKNQKQEWNIIFLIDFVKAEDWKVAIILPNKCFAIPQ